MPPYRRYRLRFVLALSALTAGPLIAAFASAPSASQNSSALAGDSAWQVETPYPTHDPATAEATSTATPTAESTSTVEASATQDASVSPTLLPSATATTLPPSPTAGPQGFAPSSSAPLCSDHDSRAYHGLWDAQQGCHYDHSHGDDPHSVDDIFGTEIYDWMDGEISYPWHTPAENEAIKHKSYLWLVERDIPCYSRYSNGCITAFRAFVHNDLHNPGPSHHSGLLEAIVCDENDRSRCGYVFISGHQATGDLFIDRRQVKNGEEPPRSPRPQMLHNDVRGNRNFATWYPVFHAWMRIATQVSDMWGYYPASSRARPQDFVPLGGNASAVQPHVVSVGLRRADLPVLDRDGDGRLNYEGFVNVTTGQLGGECTAVGEMCSPFIFRDVPRVAGLGFQYRGGDYHEFDVFIDGRSSGWLVFPGFQP
jgi:hypothetical protein